MKRTGLIILFVFFYLGICQSPAAADNIKLYINGAEKLTDPAPFIDSQSGRTFVPVRFIAESFGADVTWLETEKKVVIKQSGNGKTIYLSIYNKQASVNGNTVNLDAEPRIVNGRTVIPLRFVAENLDLDVVWDETGKTISIKNKIAESHSSGNVVIKPSNTSAEIEPIELSDGRKISIHLQEGWKYQEWDEKYEYTKWDESVQVLFKLTHTSGASVNLVIEDLPDKIERDDYLTLFKQELMDYFNPDGWIEEDLLSVYKLTYTVKEGDEEYNIYQQAIFPRIGSNDTIEKYVLVYTLGIPTDITTTIEKKVKDDANLMVDMGFKQ